MDNHLTGCGKNKSITILHNLIQLHKPHATMHTNTKSYHGCLIQHWARKQHGLILHLSSLIWGDAGR